MIVRQEIHLSFRYPVHFTHDLFDGRNPLLAEIVREGANGGAARLLFVLDAGLLRHHPNLPQTIEAHCHAHASDLQLATRPLILPGGEAAKSDPQNLATLYAAIHEARLCRHCFIIAVGGGALIDLAGYAAATAHRGLRLIRVPTTVLSQNDAAIGVKNSINAFGRKNFLGTFAPPLAVLNDSSFLPTLSDRDWRAGVAEAVKVALIKDAAFLDQIEADAPALVGRDMPAMQRLIERCAELHLRHIATAGDPFELGSARPLDFGHWAAHKLEQLTDFQLRHGEAVAIGIALDTTYSCLAGLLSQADQCRVLKLLSALGFALWVPQLQNHLNEPDHPDCVLRGLEEFREHLGGPLTIMLLQAIGRGVEVHHIDPELVRESIAKLREQFA